jgi:basic amino acid/polyamine antiporter, APA family
VPNLKRELKLFDVFSIAAGAMISSGLFILPGLAYYKSGPAVILAYLLAGILIIPTMLSQAELSTAMPKAGGTYFFIFRSLGSNFGTLAGLSSWFSLILKSAFAIVGIGTFTTIIFPDLTMLQVKLIGAGFCIFFMTLNIFSAKHAGRMQVLMVVFLFIILLFYVFEGVPKIANNNFENFMKGDLKTLFMTSGMVFISFLGLTKIVSVAEEVKDPARNIPKGMILAFLTVMLLYLLVVFVTVGVMGDKLNIGENGYSLTPISDGAQFIIGDWGKYMLSFAALLAFFSTANAGIMAASRDPLAMSQDQLIPSFLSKINSRFKTPVNSIILTGLVMTAVIFLPLEVLVKTASTMMLLLFIFVNISLVIMRESGIQNYRPKYKSPLYPWLQIFAVISYSFLIIEMGKTTLIISAAFIGLCVLWFLFYGRIRSNHQSALLNIVNRIKSKDLETTSLETELKEIIRERDEILQDRFDSIIETADIIDIGKAVNKEEFFQLVAEKICDSFETSCENFYQLLIDRENESSTVLTENLAIPHIIIAGEKKFNILLVRCKDGIYFSEEAPKVQIVFVIAGTRDERNFHLQALAAIAQIIQNANFEKKWLSAKNTDALRDIVLLGERRRK